MRMNRDSFFSEQEKVMNDFPGHHLNFIAC